MFTSLLTSLVQKTSILKQWLVCIRTPSAGKDTSEGVFGSVARIYIATIFALLGLSLMSVIYAEQASEIRRDHKRFYQNGAVLDISGVLGLSSIEKGSVKEVTVRYNMVRSRLEVDWLYNGEVVGHTSMPKGLKKSIHFNYDRTLPGAFSVRFSGAKGQVQLLRVSATIGDEQIRSSISEKKSITPQVDKRVVTMSDRIPGSQDKEGVTNSLKQATDKIRDGKSIETELKVVKPNEFQIMPFVPDVVGKSRQDAEAIIERKGFQLKVDNLTSFKEIYRGEEGMVILQSPEAGKQRPEGSEVTITVYSPTSMTNYPDFVVTEILMNPADLKEYDQVTFSAKIKNIGQKADKPSCLNIKIGGTCDVGECSTQVLTSLAPGEERTIEINKLYQCIIYPGENLVTARIDSTNVIRENDENNNTLSKKISLPTLTPQQGILDLYIDRIRSANGTTAVSALEQGEYNVSIINPYYHINDTDPIPDVHLRGITENGVDEHITKFTMQGNETTVPFRFPRPFSSLGKHYIKFTVDYGDRVNEMNERNNSAWTYVQVNEQKPMPDMIVTDIIMDPPAPQLFDNIRVGVKIKNIGDKDSMPGCFAVYLRGNRVGHCSGPVLQTLAAGQEATYWVPNIYPLTFMISGENILTADADDFNAVFESNERNNRFTRKVNIPEYQPSSSDIDLAIDRIRIANSQGSVAEDELPEFDIYIQNHFYSLNQNPPIHNIRLTGVSEDESHRVETSFTMDSHEKKVTVRFPTALITEGNHYFKFSVDVGNRVQEFNENNNDRWGVIRVMKKQILPDNVITRIFLDPENPQAYDQVRVGVNVKNVGDKTATSIGCFEASIGSCKVNYCSGGTSEALETGEERVIWSSRRQFCAISPGEINITAKIDTNNNVWESDENNNIMEKKILVPAPPSGPDLMVTNIRVMNQVYVGSRANIEVTIKNNSYVFGGQNPDLTNVNLEISTPDGHSQTTAFDMNSYEKKLVLTFTEPFSEVDYNGFDIVAKVDTTNRVNEINENNNQSLGWMQVITAQ
jgi:subtilase family serine protease